MCRLTAIGAAVLSVACGLGDVDVVAPDIPSSVRTCSPRSPGLVHLPPARYDRVVAEITGVEVDLGSSFPTPTGAYASHAEGQALSTATLQAGWDAAAAVADLVLERGDRTWRTEFEDVVDAAASYAPASGDGTWISWTVGSDPERIAVPVEVPHAGRYLVTVRAQLREWGEVVPADPVAPWLALDAPGVSEDDTHLVLALGSAVGTYAWTATLPAGAQELGVSVLPQQAVVLGLDGVVVEGPLDDPFATDGPARRRWVTCDLDAEGRACAVEVLDALVPMAWRRPPTDAERARLVGLVDEGAAATSSVEEGLRLAVRAVFASPYFLLRIEDVGDLEAGDSRKRTPWERADRLAAVLWAARPDPELLACAAAGGLQDDDDPCGLSAQIDRLMADPRHRAVADDWAPQWLGLGALATAVGQPPEAGGLSPDLADAMQTQAVEAVGRVLASGAPLPTLLDDDEVWTDAVLAAHQGFETPSGGVGTVTPGDRVGVLGLAAVSVATAKGARTSPARRGAWIAARLLCDPPGAPPDGVEALPASDGPSGSPLEAIEAHRARPSCAACHDTLDPLGVAWEGLDAQGRPRSEYPDGTPVVSATTLPDGTDVADHVALARHLAGDPDVAACLRDQLVSWAAQRPLTEDDACLLDLVDAAIADGGALDDVLAAVARHEALAAVGAP